MLPTGKNIHIELITVSNQTSSGIHIPGMPVGVVEEYANVVATGPEVTICKPGDVVFFKEYNVDRIVVGSGTLEPDKKATLAFINEAFVIAVDSK